MPSIANVNDAKAAITYNTDEQPWDSIFGRYDILSASNPDPSYFGAIDAKVASTSMVRAFMGLSGKLDPSVHTPGFWMRYGTPHVKGTPFIWSQSIWSSLPHPYVPDVVDGSFTDINLHLK